MDRYERRNAEMVFAVRDAAARVSKGDWLTVSGLGGHDGTFDVEDVSEPNADGEITLTLTERR